MHNKTAHHTVHDRRAVVFAKAKLLVSSFLRPNFVVLRLGVHPEQGASCRQLRYLCCVELGIFVLIRQMAPLTKPVTLVIHAYTVLY